MTDVRRPILRNLIVLGSIHKVLHVTLEELYNGTVKSVTVFRYESCLGCHGRGYDAAAHPHTCKKCQGTGVKTITKKTNGVIRKRMVRCFECDGKGRFIREDDICNACRGKGTTRKKKTYVITIPCSIEF